MVLEAGSAVDGTGLAGALAERYRTAFGDKFKVNVEYRSIDAQASALAEYINTHGGGGDVNVNWGNILGTMVNQVDLMAGLNGKVATTSPLLVSSLRCAFGFADVLDGSVLVGVCPAGRIVKSVLLEIEAAFDAGMALTVGDGLAAGRLMVAMENDPTQVAKYENAVGHQYGVDASVRVYVSGVVPTMGAGVVTIFLS